MSATKKFNLVQLVGLVFISLNLEMCLASSNKTENIWLEAGRMTGLLLQNCMQITSNGPQDQFLLILQQCLQRRSLIVLDRYLDHDVIELISGVELVKRKEENGPVIDKRRDLTIYNATFQSTERQIDWKSRVLQRIAHVFNTHILKIHLNGYDGLINEARGPKKKSMMLSLIMFAVVALGMVMIPMGFQFLAVLGGKALLLAKLALILTSIQGLKKIATSHWNYGLYSAPTDHHAGHWHYDRQWPYESEGHEGKSPINYYEASDQQMDLLHPFHPRVDAYKNKYME